MEIDGIRYVTKTQWSEKNNVDKQIPDFLIKNKKIDFVMVNGTPYIKDTVIDKKINIFDVVDICGEFKIIEVKFYTNGVSYFAECLKCGNKLWKSQNRLIRKSGPDRNCGCRIDRSRIGESWGELVIVKEYSNRSSSGGKLFECLCSCGRTTILPSSKIRYTMSCGHLYKEMDKNKKEKECSVCGETKLLDQFRNAPGMILGKKSDCIDCERQKRKVYMYKLRQNKPYIQAWRSMITRLIKIKKIKKNDTTYNLLGYTPDELRFHIESLWTDGMSWDNWGRGSECWHIDHIKPVSSFDPDTLPAIVNALSNLRPMWAISREVNGIWYEGNLNRNKKNENY